MQKTKKLSRAHLFYFISTWLITFALVLAALTGNPLTTDYYVVDYLGKDRCDILNSSGELLGSYPLSYCEFTGEPSIFGGLKNPGLRDVMGRTKWSLDLRVDHHSHYDPASGSVWIKHNDCMPAEEDERKCLEIISELDLSGRLLFQWKVSEHRDEFKRLNSNFHFEPHGITDVAEPGRKKPKMLFETKINFIHVIKDNAYAKSIPHMAAGNILIGCWKTWQLYIIDRRSLKIVWNYSFKDKNMVAPHTGFVRPDGKIVFFINNVHFSKRLAGNAALGIYDSANNNLEVQPVQLKNGKLFRSFHMGSVYPDGDGYIVLASEPRILVRLNRDGTTAWEKELTVPPDKSLPYRARAVSSKLVDPFLKQQL